MDIVDYGCVDLKIVAFIPLWIKPLQTISIVKPPIPDHDPILNL